MKNLESCGLRAGKASQAVRLLQQRHKEQRHMEQQLSAVQQRAAGFFQLSTQLYPAD